uniref:Ovule protein n=1 Tax=Steinernema glaseri TaxID=37863 RepID=A0A1I8ASY1_9BILA
MMGFCKESYSENCTIARTYISKYQQLLFICNRRLTWLRRLLHLEATCLCFEREILQIILECPYVAICRTALLALPKSIAFFQF